MTISDFQNFKISSGALSACVTPQGAALTGLYLHGHPRSLVLQYQDENAYIPNKLYLGSIVGRFANRVSGASFRIGNKVSLLDKNWLDQHCLHGGSLGIAHQTWQIENQSDNSLTLTKVDKGRETGFPGDCRITVCYSISDEQCLEIKISAICDEPTPCSITAHPYFNLGLTNTISDHSLQIDANHYLPTDHENIPTGEVRDVKQTEYDFRNSKRISDTDYDHNFCVAYDRQEIRKAAEVFSPDTGIRMKIWSNETGLQFYNGTGLTTPFCKHEGLCLEPQAWPDAPNQSSFPDCTIRVDERYEHIIRYEFYRHE